VQRGKRVLCMLCCCHWREEKAKKKRHGGPRGHLEGKYKEITECQYVLVRHWYGEMIISV
jgi:hypothetical protein